MRYLFVTGGGAATVFAMAPLAHAVRNAGHEVIVAAPQESAQTVSNIGLPSTVVTELGVYRALFFDRAGVPLQPPTPDDGEDEEMRFAGRGFARLAASSLADLRTLVTNWQPHVIVGGALTHAAPLIAHEFDLPFVRQAWDIHESTDIDRAAATAELAPELASLDLTEIPREDLFVETTPPSLRLPDAPAAQLMRWLPGNAQRPLEDWMYTTGDRPRVLITSGSRSLLVPTLGSAFFEPLLDSPALADVDIVVATSEEVADQLREKRPGLRGGWLPLDVVVRTCDLVIHHGGGVTSLTAISAGVPTLTVPVMASSIGPESRLEDAGASLVLPSAHEPADVVAEAIRALLEDPRFTQNAQRLAEEISALPPAAHVVSAIDRLVTERSARRAAA